MNKRDWRSGVEGTLDHVSSGRDFALDGIRLVGL